MKYLLESDEIQNNFFKNQDGTAIQNVPGVKILKKIQIPLPSIKVQGEILESIQNLENQIEAKTNEIKLIRKRINEKLSGIYLE